MTFFLENKDKERVQLPEERAIRFFGLVAETDAIAGMGRTSGGEDDVEDVEDGEEGLAAESAVQLGLASLEYDRATLEATVAYAMREDADRTASIPRPMPRPLTELILPSEMAFMAAAEQRGCHVQLLDIAAYLKFDHLLSLCSAYMAARIEEIARAAGSIMEGAETIREFLRMHNEWTPEEMEHLRKEMEYAKLVDPRVY